MPSKTLTPKEFEDKYLGRSKERPKNTAGIVKSERTATQNVLEKPHDAFRPGEGFEKRVQAFYDAAFDRAFEDITSEVEHSDAEFGIARLAAVKRFRSQDIYWGDVKNMDDNGVVDIEVSKAVPPDGVESELYIRGVITLDRIGYLPNMTNSGQMNACVGLEPAPAVTLCIKPLSWKLAAINLAGALGRLQFLDQESDANMDVESKMFLQELTAAEVQIDLADHLSNGIFGTQISRTLQSRLGAYNPDQFISKTRIKEWSAALTGFSFGRMNPPVGKNEELARSWLCRMAALRHFAYKRAGNAADPQAKLDKFAELYLKYSREFRVDIR